MWLVSMMCSLHPLKLIEEPLTLDFNTIILACQGLPSYLCMFSYGTPLRASCFILPADSSSPFSKAHKAPMWRGVKSLSWSSLFTLISTFRGPGALSRALCIRLIYYQSFITMTWHTFSDYASKAWLKGIVRWKVYPPLQQHHDDVLPQT